MLRSETKNITPSSRKSPTIVFVNRILADPDNPAVPRLETEIDAIAYSLYWLTTEEITLIEKTNEQGTCNGI